MTIEQQRQKTIKAAKEIKSGKFQGVKLPYLKVLKIGSITYVGYHYK